MEAVREYAASEGYEVLEEIKDLGYSGASLKRPGMDRIRDLVAAGRASVVLAQDRDHFAREPAYHYHLEKAFEEKGIKLRPHNNPGDDTPKDRLLGNIQDDLAEYEREKRRGLLQARVREEEILRPERDRRPAS